jgi:hypothetical protein
VNRVPRWRLAAAVAVLAALLGFGAVFAPTYIANLRLQSYVSDLTRDASSAQQSDDALRARVVAKASALNLPVRADNVHIERAEGLRISVRYFVRVDLPGYTVDLHFYPGAGSQ